VEEVARVRGLDALPETLPVVRRPLESFGQPEGRYSFLARIKNWGSGLGLSEAINYSFVGHADLDRLGLPEEGRISVMNPLSEDQNVLRTVLAPGLLNCVRNNIARGNGGARLFECAHVFCADVSSETTAREVMTLGLAVCGARFDALWPHSDADADYHDLRGLVEHLLRFLHLPAPSFEPLADHPYLLPAMAIIADGHQAGVLGCVKKDIADFYHARKQIWLAELNLEQLSGMHAAAEVKFAALPVYPASWRDVTFKVRPGISVSEIIGHVRDLRFDLLERIELADVYAPSDQADRRLTFRLTFRHAQRTLKDSEVDKAFDFIIKSLCDALKIEM
jgi:phenylalanyl-tRNA synthetase beta chain